MSSFPSRGIMAALCVIVGSSAVSAQASTQSDSARVAPTDARPAPTIMALPAQPDVAFRTALSEDVRVVRRRQAFARPTVLMIVGGALILTGIIVDDKASTALYIAGAGIGGYGLYLYLQSADTRFTR